MYYRNEENNQQEMPQLQDYTYTQCPWADNCPYMLANDDTMLRQYHPYHRPPYHRPHYHRPHYFMPYHPYYPPFYQPFYPPYYHHPYEHYYQPHRDYEEGYEMGAGED